MDSGASRELIAAGILHCLSNGTKLLEKETEFKPSPYRSSYRLADRESLEICPHDLLCVENHSSKYYPPTLTVCFRASPSASAVEHVPASITFTHLYPSRYPSPCKNLNLFSMTQSSSQPAMPGAFNFAQRDHGAVPRLSGAKSHIFQPPRTPSVSASSSLYLTRSATSSAMSTDQQTSANAGRKRSRVDYDMQTPYDDWAAGEAPGSPVPFVNTRYVLAGGMDTPSLAASKVEDAQDSEYYSDVGYRRELSDDNKLQGLLGEESKYQSFAPLGFDGESSGKSRSRASSRQFIGQGEGWSRTALEVVGGVVGGVVGKVWEFCKTSAFRGFHAGGGKSYTITTNADPIHSSIEEDSFWDTEKSATTYGMIDRESTPLPGQFPEEDFIPDYLDRATPEATPPRAAKRRQVDNSKDELAKNWVVVPPPTNTHTPSKPRSTGLARYSMPTASSASRRSVAGKPASRAGGAVGLGPRRPTLQSRVSHAGSPSLQSKAGASFASPRSPGGSKIPRGSPMGVKPTTAMNPDSPAAKEAQRWAAMKRKEEREADESIRRLDAQLKAMIREGKEALGTKVEVELDDDFDSYAGKTKKWAF